MCQLFSFDSVLLDHCSPILLLIKNCFPFLHYRRRFHRRSTKQSQHPLTWEPTYHPHSRRRRQHSPDSPIRFALSHGTAFTLLHAYHNDPLLQTYLAIRAGLGQAKTTLIPSTRLHLHQVAMTTRYKPQTDTPSSITGRL